MPNHQRNINDIETKILSLYSKGMTTIDILEQIKELYEFEISEQTISNITNRIFLLVSKRQNRTIEQMY